MTRERNVRRGLFLTLALALLATSACGPAVMGVTETRPAERVQIQRHPAELTVYDRETRRRYRVDLAARRCYEVFALLDHCPPEGDHALCPADRDAVRASNAQARTAGSIGGCERDGCPDPEHAADCSEVRGLDDEVATAMGW